jgi:hypothetical protein
MAEAANSVISCLLIVPNIFLQLTMEHYILEWAEAWQILNVAPSPCNIPASYLMAKTAKSARPVHSVVPEKHILGRKVIFKGF